MLVTFGCPVVGNTKFVALQNRLVALSGGLRIFNMHDPVPSLGKGFLQLTDAARNKHHGGHAIELRNKTIVHINPMSNHLTYVIDSAECFPGQPCARAAYTLPGFTYTPERDATTPIVSDLSPPSPKKRDGSSSGSSSGATEDEGAASTGAGEAAGGGGASWRTKAGREEGREGYVFGDITRSAMRWLQVPLGHRAAPPQAQPTAPPQAASVAPPQGPPQGPPQASKSSSGASTALAPPGDSAAGVNPASAAGDPDASALPTADVS